MRGFVGIALIIILGLPAAVLSHPGKTDRRGGHECKKDCSEWDLYVGEYHIHEGDFHQLPAKRDIRPKSVPPPEQRVERHEAKPPDLPPLIENNPTDPSVEEKKAVHPAPQSPPVPAAALPKPAEPEGFFMEQQWLLLTALGLIILLVALMARRARSGRFDKP